MIKKEINLKKLSNEISSLLVLSEDFDRLDYSIGIKKLLNLVTGISNGTNMVVDSGTLGSLDIENIRTIFLDYHKIVLELITISAKVREMFNKEKKKEEETEPKPAEETVPIVRTHTSEISYVI